MKYLDTKKQFSKKYVRQVKPDHYKFDTYLNLERWISYYNQITEVKNVSQLLNKASLKVLVIGPGDGIVGGVLKNLGMELTTMDIDPDLKPDHVSALPQINIPLQERFDCILCCEVLEHISYEDMEKSISGISKISRYAIISVPHASLLLSLSFKFVYFKTLRYLFSLDLDFREHKIKGQHYWELGYKGYSYDKFKNSLQKANMEILKDFRVKDNPWHHFVVVKSHK